MASTPFICARCVRNLGREALPSHPLPIQLNIRGSGRGRIRPSSTVRASSSTASQPAASPDHQSTRSSPADRSNTTVPPDQRKDDQEEPGALTRRLLETTEEALLTGSRSDRRTVLEQSGFGDELKERLLSKISDARFRSSHSSAFAAAELDSGPRMAGRGTLDLAAAKPWTGTEEMGDAVLRMLDDAHKPLRRDLGRPVDMRIRPQRREKPGARAANARDRASAYAGLEVEVREREAREGRGLSEREREEMRREFRERFTPGARAMPGTISGLAALANERIEDAIARGQFKNIPRGKGVERDTRADNPFIDTTEYIMNKMIQRQEIVPPWIEKQQELIKAATVFRSRLRADWKRHAARMMASGGGTLQEKMARATEYARAEEIHNPRRRNVEQIAVPTNATDDAVVARLRKEAVDAVGETTTTTTTASPSGDESSGSTEPQVTLTGPFRDPDWIATEKSYMELAVANLNAITRSYNLMAPELAKKPYFNLERELNNCFADVAPLLAGEIKERATRPALKDQTGGGHGTRMGVLDRFAREGKSAKVYESRAPHYGFRDMWRDLWGGAKGG